MRFPQFNSTGSPRGPQGIFKTGVIGIGQISSNASQTGPKHAAVIIGENNMGLIII